jgi:hypothetical protein
MKKRFLTGFQKLLKEYLKFTNVYAGIPVTIPETLIVFIPDTLFTKSVSGSTKDIEVDIYIYSVPFDECFNYASILTDIIITERDNFVFDSIDFKRVVAVKGGKYLGITNELGILQYLYHVRLSVNFKEI